MEGSGKPQDPLSARQGAGSSVPMAWCPASSRATARGGDPLMELSYGLSPFQSLLFQISEVRLL